METVDDVKIPCVTLLGLLAGCDPAADLPEGWEDAEAVDDFTQSECEGSPLDTGWESSVSATADDPGLRAVGENLVFPCSMDVEGFYRVEYLDSAPMKHEVAVLVQPVDMDPDEVAGCDCLYRVEAGIPEDPPATVWLFTRQGTYTDENDPEKVGTAEVAR